MHRQRAVAVPGRYQYVKWWKCVLVISGCGSPAAEVGAESVLLVVPTTIDKTPAVFMVLVYVVACTVAA